MKSKLEIYEAAIKIRQQIYQTRTYSLTNSQVWLEALARIIDEYISDINKTDRDNEILKYLEGRIKNKQFSEVDMASANPRIDAYLHGIFINNVIDEAFSIPGIQLSDDWKAKAASYVFHIRDIVSKAEMIEGLRERIFDRLNQLQSESDRNRTYVESISAVFLTITEAMSSGAKHLEPAVKLVERLAGALSGFNTASVEHEAQFKLSGPEQFGLDDLPSDNTSE